MIELKATTAQEIVRNEKDCDYMDELFGGVKMPPTQVYLKSDADAVLAEKDRLIAKLEKKLDEMDNLVKENKDLLLESQKMHLKCANNASTQIRRLTRYLYLVLADLHERKAEEYSDVSFVRGKWLDDDDEKQCYRKEKCAARCREMADRLGG